MNEEIQEKEHTDTSDTLGIDLPVEEANTEIIPITPTEDILISIHQVEQKQLERLEVINDFIYLFVVVIVVYACYKFIWGLLSYERF